MASGGARAHARTRVRAGGGALPSRTCSATNASISTCSPLALALHIATYIRTSPAAVQRIYRSLASRAGSRSAATGPRGGPSWSSPSPSTEGMSYSSDGSFLPWDPQRACRAHPCAQCHKPNATKRCARCGLAHYCSTCVYLFHVLSTTTSDQLCIQ